MKRESPPILPYCCDSYLGTSYMQIHIALARTYFYISRLNTFDFEKVIIQSKMLKQKLKNSTKFSMKKKKKSFNIELEHFGDLPTASNTEDTNFSAFCEQTLFWS